MKELFEVRFFCFFFFLTGVFFFCSGDGSVTVVTVTAMDYNEKRG